MRIMFIISLIVFCACNWGLIFYFLENLIWEIEEKYEQKIKLTERDKVWQEFENVQLRDEIKKLKEELRRKEYENSNEQFRDSEESNQSRYNAR